MEIDEKDVLSFLRNAFVKESDPGSLTVRVLRENYCKDRNIPNEYSKEQRRAFAMVVDSVFNKFAEAQEAAKAMKPPMLKSIMAKRPFSQNLPDDDFRPTKRPKISPKVQVDLPEDDFQPTKLSIKFAKSNSRLSDDEVLPSKATEDSVVNVVDKPAPVSDEDIHKILASIIVKTPVDDCQKLDTNKTSQSSISKDDGEVPEFDALKSNANCSSDKSELVAEKNSDVGQVNGSSSGDAASKLRLESSSDDEKPIPSPCHAQESSGDACTSAGEASREQSEETEDCKPESDKCISDSLATMSSDDEFQQTVTAAKNKINHSKILLDEENAAPQDAKSSKAKAEKPSKKSEIDHKSPKQLKRGTKGSKSDKIKMEKLRKTDKKPKKPDLDAIDDDFSSEDEEPLSGLMKRVANAKDNTRKILDKDNGETDESDSGAFKEKEKKVKKAQKSSENEDKESKDPHLKQHTDPELTLLKVYLREAGIRVMYVKIFKDCESLESQKQVLTSLLVNAGLKETLDENAVPKICPVSINSTRFPTTNGKPSVEKCRKLRVQRETKKEVDELDTSNILGNTEGRTRRSTRNIRAAPSPSPDVVKPAKLVSSSDSSAKKIFQRLKGIVDSEDSD